MNNSRISILEKYIAEDATDPFNYYALALEYVKENPMKASELFDKLLNDFPHYLPSYYSAGTFYAEIQQDEKASDILKRGIALAKQQNELKALRELQNALQNLDA